MKKTLNMTDWKTKSVEKLEKKPKEAFCIVEKVKAHPVEDLTEQMDWREKTCKARKGKNGRSTPRVNCPSPTEFEGNVVSYLCLW